MKSNRWGRLLAIAVLLVGGSAVLAQKLGDFYVPSYNDNGEKESELRGKNAVVTSGIAEISDFSLTFFEEGTTNVKMRISAPDCVYNQAGRIAKSDSKVKIEAENMVVTGQEFAWDGTRELFKIFKDSKVVLSNMDRTTRMKKLGVEGESDADDE